MSTRGLSSAQIPVIDISGEEKQVGDELVEAVIKWGFVFVHGEALGFDSHVINDTFDLARQFFSSPLAKKHECHISPDNKGYSSMHSEILDQGNQKRGDCKEAFNIGEFMEGRAQQPLPEVLRARELDLSHFALRCHRLCITLLRFFALGLKIREDEGGKEWFASRHDQSSGRSGTILRLLHYPTLAAGAFDYDAAVDIRAGAHSDYGSLTLLFQRPSQPGLEILTPDSKWAPVPVYPPSTETDPFPPILVNVGDLLSYWTNGLLKSTVHRVVFPNGEGGDRFSMAYFCHPVDDAPLITIPSDLVANKSAAGANVNADSVPMTAAEHLKSRLAATYGWRTQSDPSQD